MPKTRYKFSKTRRNEQFLKLRYNGVFFILTSCKETLLSLGRLIAVIIDHKKNYHS